MICKYYRLPDESQPVVDYIHTLEPNRRAVIANQITLLNRFGVALDYPHTSQISGELRELRCHYGRELYRILYRRRRQFFVLLHAFPKRVEKIDPADIKLAELRWDDFLARMAEPLPRKRRRPLGKDAP